MSQDGGVAVWRRIWPIAEIEGRIHITIDYLSSKRADEELIHLPCLPTLKDEPAAGECGAC